MHGGGEGENLADRTRIVARVGFVDASDTECWISTFFSEVCSHTVEFSVENSIECVLMTSTTNYANYTTYIVGSIRDEKKRESSSEWKNLNFTHSTELAREETKILNSPHTTPNCIVVEHVIVVIPCYHMRHRLNIDVVNVAVKLKCRINFVMSLIEGILVFISNVELGCCGLGGVKKKKKKKENCLSFRTIALILPSKWWDITRNQQWERKRLVAAEFKLVAAPECSCQNRCRLSSCNPQKSSGLRSREIFSRLKRDYLCLTAFESFSLTLKHSLLPFQRDETLVWAAELRFFPQVPLRVAILHKNVILHIQWVWSFSFPRKRKEMFMQKNVLEFLHQQRSSGVVAVWMRKSAVQQRQQQRRETVLEQQSKLLRLLRPNELIPVWCLHSQLRHELNEPKIILREQTRNFVSEFRQDVAASCLWAYLFLSLLAWWNLQSSN